MFDLIKLSLWGNGSTAANHNIFEEMLQQAIAALPFPYLAKLDISPELREEWKRYALQRISFYIKSQYIQANFPITQPYVILKGTSAAKYYPYPECRTMGDIDIMTRREDLDTACKQLVDNGYRVIKELNREISLEKDGIVVELHRRFATLSDPDQAKYLDDLIINNINPSHVLPDPVNGLVLLQHMDQHMEGGIGLRQIIDWMMFVDKCLPDDKWAEFKVLAENTGLEKLALVSTRMCEMYLGLRHREWCAAADETLCRQLMEYVLSSGNFGNKKTTDTAISINAFTFASSLKLTFQLLEKQGLQNWKAARKYKILRPFAWIYQINRYLIKGLHREKALSKIKAEYSAAKKRNAMFEALGINTVSKGTVNYIDGQYIKE